MVLSTYNKGAVSEYRAAAYFGEQGYEIFWNPTNGLRYDFIAFGDEGAIKVQVKTASWLNQNGSKYLRASIRPKRPYKKGDFDFLVLVAPDRRLWVIPYDDVPKRSYVYLERIDNTGQRKEGRWTQCQMI
tara:strand:+ start:452 stop:841 length:390 start_codon:yes stop_codon:yes gene_type:complete